MFFFTFLRTCSIYCGLSYITSSFFFIQEMRCGFFSSYWANFTACLMFKSHFWAVYLYLQAQIYLLGSQIVKQKSYFFMQNALFQSEMIFSPLRLFKGVISFGFLGKSDTFSYLIIDPWKGSMRRYLSLRFINGLLAFIITPRTIVVSDNGRLPLTYS